MRLPQALANTARRAAVTIPLMVDKESQLYAVQWAMAMAYQRGHRVGLLMGFVVGLLTWVLYVATI